MQINEPRVDVLIPGADEKTVDITRAQAKFAEVFEDRCAKAQQRYLDAVNAGSQTFKDTCALGAKPVDLWRDASAYWIDAAQRSVLFWDTLRQRGNNWIDHERAGKPPLLDYDWEMIADARTFEKPCNYALVRIIPPDGVKTDRKRRPFVVIDPRAGHGPGIGGFKQDSQVGVALKAGHPVYFVIFYPEPVPGQTLADVSRAETEFLRIVGERHPETRKPVVIGNCQGGWAAMLVGALEPDLCGPIVINGAPMSYWAGNDGENPMRYAGGVLGGVWPALLASDLGAGAFDGANLVDNFEYLNPANTFCDKLYNLYAKIDTEPERFLEFERWWGGHFMMDREEIKWIVENLFVGNKLASGEAEWSQGRAFDLREIKSPIILFASLGDNITPPQQAFNWIMDLYPTTEALKANGQVIVGLMHQSVGHLGIFVSGHVARREHAQIVDLIEHIEHLAPGLYGMKVEEKREHGAIVYDVLLTEMRVEDLHVLQKYDRKDEVAFEAVASASTALASAYETYVHPVLAATITPAAAAFTRMMHPQRLQRWSISDLNPFVRPLKEVAELVKANRMPRNEDGPLAKFEHLAIAVTSASWDYYRDMRDASVENRFFMTYGTAALAFAEEEKAAPTAEDMIDVRTARLIKNALASIETGDKTTAMVRIALLLMKAGTGRSRLSTMRRARELFSKDMGLLEIPTDEARDIIRQQSYIADFEPEQALATLPKLLAGAEDRRAALDFLNRLETHLEANPKQSQLLGEMRRRLSPREPVKTHQPEEKIVRLHKREAARSNRHHARGR